MVRACEPGRAGHAAAGHVAGRLRSRSGARAPQWQDAAEAAPELQTTAKYQRLVLPGLPPLGQWAQALANPLFTQTYRHHSFWLPAQAEVDLNPSSSLTVVPGLPDPDQFLLMLEGRW